MEDEDEALLFLHVLYAQKKKKKKGGVCIEDFSDDFFYIELPFFATGFPGIKREFIHQYMISVSVIG